MNDRFNFFIPLEADFKKSANAEPHSEDWYNNMLIQGVASDNSLDSDNQILEPSGYEIDDFVRGGFIDFEHKGKDKASFHVGEPINASVKGNQFHIKGKLWSKSERARDLYDTMHVMKESGSDRKVGWSIEGRAIRKDPMNKNRITKALISKVTLSFTPKNKNTWADIMKGGQDSDFVNYEYDEEANGGKEYILDVTSPDGTRTTIDKSFNIKVVKAMEAGSETGRSLDGKDTSGAALKRESLDKKLTNLQPEFKMAIIKLAKQHNEEPFSEELLIKTQKSIKKILL